MLILYIFPTKHTFLQHTFWLSATVAGCILDLVKTLTVWPPKSG
jgi:hypothetical protein